MSEFSGGSSEAPSMPSEAPATAADRHFSRSARARSRVFLREGEDGGSLFPHNV